MENRHIYQLDIKWKKDRIGEMNSPDLNDKVTVATPPEFPGGVPGIWSPEHLYTASVLSCFMTTFLAIAEYSKIDFLEFDCRAEGILEKIDGKFIMSEIHLKPQVKFAEVVPIERGRKILEKAEKACLISNSIKTKVSLDLSEVTVTTIFNG